MTTPCVTEIKKVFPQSLISYATNTKYLQGALVKTLQYNPNINEIIERDTIKDIRFDLVVNLHCPAIMHERPQKIPPNRIDLFAKHAGLTLTDPVPKYYIQQTEIEAGAELLRGLERDKTILVQAQASSQKRSLPSKLLKDSLIALSKLGWRSIILVHEDSDHPTDTMWDNIPGSVVLKNLDIRGIASVMVHVDLTLCPDSSILHLAGALGAPCVGLFGPTPPMSRIDHYANCVAVWHGDKIAACPCWYEHCPTGYSCWQQMRVEDIVEACLKKAEENSTIDLERVIQNIPEVHIETEII